MLFKMKSRLRIDDKACVDLTDKFMQMIEISLVVAVFGALTLSFIDMGATAISDYANDSYAENGTGIVNTLYGILANDQVVYIMLLSAFIFVIIFTVMNVMKKARKR